MTRNLWCVACHKHVTPTLVTGADVYPHRPDLAELPFWRCGTCGNFVGCHHKSPNPTQPLGCIPTPELKKLRQAIHQHLDPKWQSGMRSRGALYRELSDRLGWKFHTASIRTVQEAHKVLDIVRKMP